MTSNCTAEAVLPSAWIIAVVACAESRSISETTTWAPRLANLMAVALPIPLPAPVTTTSWGWS
ncbi:Uncharacterised protein [Mycobacteroides abscessus subsp. abscessus]|nr:Uncharacterised protein [Mycobacteroides abscessus subsp. abscessus]SLA12008.1 Uncharacterised protein [Mycobacteroides abscessus subsp. abscessus]